MNKKIGEDAIDLIITLGSIIIILLFFDLATDDYAYFMSALAAKQFSDFAYFDVHFQGFMGVREVYKILYYILPEINWHFVFQMITEGLCLLLILFIRKILLKNLPCC